MGSPSMPVFSTIELVRMLFGVLIAFAGVLAFLLFLARLRRKDYSLLYFGLAALLYGVRLFINGSSRYMAHQWDGFDLPITLVIGIPLTLFIAETAAARWKK